MITIERVVLKNFMKYKNLDFKFENGITSIVGQNRTGKSTLIEAVYWCLTGKRARGGTGVFRREASEKDVCLVSVYGKKDKTPFIQTRTAKFKGSQSMELSVDGNTIDYSTGNLFLDQSKLEQFLGMNQQFLLSSLLVGHNSFRFSKAPDSKRKEVFEQILNLDVYLNAKKIASDNVKVYQEQRYSAESSRDTLIGVVADMEDRMRISLEASAKKSEPIKKQLTEYKKQMVEMVKKFGDNISGFALEMSRCESIFKPRIRLLELSVKADVKIIDEMKETGKCTLCGQDLPKLAKVETINAKKLEVNKKQLELDSLYKKVNAIEPRIALYSQIQSLNIKIGQLSDAVEDTMVKVDTSLQSSIDKNKRDIKQFDKQITKLDGLITTYKFWEIGFGRQGVISLLLDSAINNLNEHLIEIAVEMTDNTIVAQYKTTTDLKSRAGTSDKLSLMCIIDGEPFDYEDLSNSEQQRVDMMTIFAIRRLIRENFESINLVFYDEVFESFDEDTTEVVFGYLKKEHIGDAAYVISHISDTQFKADRMKRVTKTVDGSSVIS